MNILDAFKKLYIAGGGNADDLKDLNGNKDAHMHNVIYGDGLDIKLDADVEDTVEEIAEGSGGKKESLPKKDVNFFDYDGTVVASYTAEEFLALDSLPANPSHKGLVAQGWNWSLEDAKEQVLTSFGCDIGQMYITESGNTEIDVEFENDARLSPNMSIAVNGEISIDWGDGTTPDVVTGSSLDTAVQGVSHNYNASGNYTISIRVINGSFSFWNNGNGFNTILYKNSAIKENTVYSNCIKAIRIGNGIDTCLKSLNYCRSLAYVTIPNYITEIGSCAFYVCYSLPFVTIPTEVTIIGSMSFQECYTLSSISIPKKATTIQNNAFYNCYSLSSVVIPNGTTVITTSPFQGCVGLSSIYVPSTVSTIKTEAFLNCCGVGEYYIFPTTPPSLGTDAFRGMPNDCTIYVPVESLDTYKSASGWSTYANIIRGYPKK